MADLPIVPSTTAMLFFDPLNSYLHPDDPKRRAEIENSGVIARVLTVDEAIAPIQRP